MKTQNQILQELKEHIASQKKQVEEAFYYQSEEQLTAKPSKNSWSASQCFEHLNLCNEHYIREIKKALPQLKPTTKDLKFKSGFIGAYMIKSMRPVEGIIKNKMKTFTKVKPLAEREKGAIVKAQPLFTDFYADLDEFNKIVSDIEGKDIQSAKVNSLIGNLVRFKVGDALVFMIAHNERHILQATQALKG